MKMLSDEELVKKTLSGDKSAFGILVERYQHATYGLAFHLLQNLLDAQDAAQEAFIRAYSNLSSLREPTKFANWLNGIVRNICLSWRRGRKEILPIERMEDSKLRSAQSTPEEILERRALWNRVMKAINSLSEKNRLAVTLYYIDGLGYDEIADFLDIPTNTVKDRLHRARGTLKESMLQMVEEEFSRYRLTPGFREEVSSAIEELECITLLTLRAESEEGGTSSELGGIFSAAVGKYEGEMYEGEEGFLSAVFGVRTSHEDAPERAILSALEVRDRLMELNRNLKSRASITTGMAEIRGQEYKLVGDTLKPASSLIEAACDGTILVCQTAYRLSKGRFLFREFREGEPHAYEVLSRSEHPRRSWDMDGLESPMIGRDGEFAKLKRYVDRLLEGEGRIVSIIGVAGIGKSRIASELRSYAEEKGVLWLEGRCISYGQRMSYTPFLEVIREFFDIRMADSGDEIRKKMETRTPEFNSSDNGDSKRKKRWRVEEEDVIPYLLNLLTGMEPEEISGLTAEQLRYRTFIAVRTLLRHAAEEYLLMVAIEDLQWIDEASYELLTFLTASVSGFPILFLCIYRPERDQLCWQFRKQASTKYSGHYSEVALFRLPSDDSRLLLRKLLKWKLPPSIEERILMRAGGNPLFLGEIMRVLVNSGKLVRAEDGWELRGEVGEIDVPDTIFSVITSRIEELNDEAKHALRCASVIGEIFPKELLEAVFEDVEEGSIRSLEELDFLVDDEHKGEYTFRHVLIKDATYSSLLPKARAELHEKAAGAMERFYSDRLDEFCEALAHHWGHTDNVEKTVEYLLKAGGKAKKAYSNENALRYYTDTLDAVENLASNTYALRVIIHENRADVLRLIGRHDEAIADYKAALELCADKEKRADLYRKIGFVCENKDELKLALEFFDLAIGELGEDTGSEEMAMVYMDIAWIIVHEGSAGKAAELLHKSLEILGSSWPSSQMALAHTRLGVAYARKGEFPEAVKYAQRGLEMSIETGDLNQTAWAYRMLGNVLLTKGDLPPAIENFQKSAEIFEETGDNRGMAFHCWVLGGIYSIKGEWDNAIEYYQRSLEWDKDLEFANPTTMNFLNLSTLYARLGDLEKAYEYIKMGIDMGFRRWESASGFPLILSSAFGRIQEALNVAGRSGEFISFCHRLMEERGEELQSMKLHQLYSETEKLSNLFTEVTFSDNFDKPELSSEWTWVNPRRDCSYDIKAAPGWIEIEAAPGCNITDLGNLDAPRLVTEIRGDFAVETKMKAICENTPMVGGVLVWKGEDGMVRLERSEEGKVSLLCKTEGEWRYLGIGRFFSFDEVYLRLERIKDSFSAYCSVNGIDWVLCEEVKLPVSDPLQVGVYAIGSIIRTAIGVVDAATGARYDYFKVLRRRDIRDQV